MALSGAQVAQVLYQAGFRGQALADMVAISYRESRWTPDAHRTDQPKSALSGDMGLFQINYSNWDLVSSKLGLTSKSQLFDPLVNARAAKVLFDASGYSPWSMGSGGWTAGGDPFYGVDRSRGTTAVNEAQAQGLLGVNWSGSTQGSGNYNVTTLGSTQGAGTGPVTLPSDAKLVANDFGTFAVFQPAPGVTIYYSVPWDGTVQYDQNSVERITNEEFNRRFPNAVGAGDAFELATTTLSFGTFQGQWDSIINQVMGFNNPARNDPEVMRVIAELAARPDMSEAELQNRLQATKWFQRRTSDELEYNSLSDAEKQKRRDEAEARMIATVFQYGGENVSADDPRIRNYVERIASGQLGFGAYTEIIKQESEANTESPWSRQVRDEQEEQRSRPINIENTAQRIREQAERWGLQWSPQTVTQWAKNMVEKHLSDEDLVTEMRNQAAILYPWKDPSVETATAAAPWLETYRRVMESSGSLFQPEVQKALTAGQGIWDFEQELKKSEKWLSTKNGQESVESTVAQMGRTFGFV